MTETVMNVPRNAGDRFGPALLVVNGVALGAIAALQSLFDLAGHFLVLGPLAGALGANPDAIGYFEAHGLALILAILMVARRADRRWHWVAAAVHALLGGANLMFWPAFETYSLVPMGVAATVLHAVFLVLELGAGFARTPHLIRDPGTVFRIAALITLATGVFLHAASLVHGREAFVERLFTPAFDAVLAVPMTIAGVAAFWSWRRAVFSALWQRLTYVLMAAYFVASVALHLRTLVTWDTSYVLAFPAWYPLVAMTVMLALIVFVSNQRFAPGGRHG